MSTQCRFCGEAVRPDSMFCPSCGQLIGASASTPVPAFGTGASSSAPKTAEEAAPAAPIAPVPLPAPLPGRARPTQVSSAPAASGKPTAASEPNPASDDAAQAAPGDAADAAADAGAQSPAVEPYVPATAVRLPDGTAVQVDQTLVLGRSPERGAPDHGGVPVRLADPERAMSRVHLLIAPDPAGAVATDQGSANGTLLERGGVRYALVAGTPTVLVRGDRLVLGDAVLTAE